MSLKCISINVRGIGSPRKCGIVASALSRWDVLFVQESHVDCMVKAERFQNEWGGFGFWSFGGARRAGVGIVFKKRKNIRVIDELRDTEGRVMSVLVEWGGARYTFLCVYAPVDLRERKVFFGKLYQYVFPNTLLIMAGDFNCVSRNVDSSCVSGANREGSKELGYLLSDLDLVDGWIHLYGGASHFTWFGQGVGSRLDRVYFSRGLMGKFSSLFVEPLGVSDHDGVKFTLQGGGQARGGGLWKFNCDLLNDQFFVREMREWLEIELELSVGSEWEEWSDLKNRMKKHIIKISKNRARMKRLKKNVITKEIITLKRMLSNGQDVNTQIERLECRLKQIVESDFEGVKIRSRVKWIEEGEKPTRYFFSLIKEHGTSNEIDVLIDENGAEDGEQRGKLGIIERFYKELYKEESTERSVQNELLTKIERGLESESCEKCEGLISVGEMEKAVKGMSMGKTPGEDGLSLEFYKQFEDLLLPFLVKVANKSYDKGFFPEGMVRSVVRLLFKKGDRSDLRNWRPISLLNVDYKIVAKALGGRLSGVMGEVTESDQTCGIPGRSIFENLNFVRDMLCDIERLGQGGVVLSLDQEKAFDRVDRGFLNRVLECFGFGDSFRGWMRVLYEGASARVICNGALTGNIVLGKGIRQGCPLSPMLYVLVAEVLACNIRAAEGVRGFLIPGSGGRESKIVQYADDATLLLRDASSVGRVLDMVDFFGRGTGARLNRGKSEAMWVGSFKSRVDKPCGIKWVVKMKILGIWFGDEVRDENWVGKVDKLKGVLNRWSGRKLSIWGRVLIVKVLGLAKLEYGARVLSVPSDIVKTVNKLIWGFVWGGKVELIRRETCLLPIKEGGLGMVDFSLRIRALHVVNVLSMLRREQCMDFCYMRYLVGNRVAKCVKDLLCLSTNLLPSSGVIPDYHVKVLEDLRCFDVKADVTVRALYLLMVSKVYVKPRCERMWCNRARGVNWGNVWGAFKKSMAITTVREVRWRIVQGVTKVRVTLKDWGHNIVETGCAVCSKPETSVHCFLECPRVKKAWGWVVFVLRSILPREFCIDVKNVFFCSFARNRREDTIIVFVIECMLKAIWVFRNRATFDRSVVSYRDVIRLCRHDIRERILIDRVRLSDVMFCKTWGVGDILARFS